MSSVPSSFSRVTVLAARPHARWGELHGLYETTGRPADTPLITLWMRTARQKRVVAFRTFLRTLLHEAHPAEVARLYYALSERRAPAR